LDEGRHLADRGAADDVVQPPHLAAAMENRGHAGHVGSVEASSEYEDDTGVNWDSRHMAWLDEYGRDGVGSRAPSALSSGSSVHRRKRAVDHHVRFASGVIGPVRRIGAEGEEGNDDEGGGDDNNTRTVEVFHQSSVGGTGHSGARAKDS